MNGWLKPCRMERKHRFKRSFGGCPKLAAVRNNEDVNARLRVS